MQGDLNDKSQGGASIDTASQHGPKPEAELAQTQSAKAQVEAPSPPTTALP